MAGACTGLKVLEIAHGMPGALAAMILADHGADVVKLESPKGDPYTGEVGSRLWNRSKQRIALNLADPAQRKRVLELARRADVIILGLRPTTAEAWGLTYEELSKDNPGLIFASITGFGWNGPYRDELAVEGMVHAMAGSMLSNLNGGFRSGPIFVAPRLASYAAALLSVQGILAALHVRETTGIGQHVDVSLLQGLLCYRGAGILKPERHQEDFPPFPAARDHRGGRPLFNLNECADGRWLSMAAFTPAFAAQALEVMGLSHVLTDPRFVGLPNVFPNDEARWELLDILWNTFRKETQETWLRRMDEHAVPCEPVLSVDEFRGHPQLWANDLAVTVQDPLVGPMIQPGLLGDLSETPGQIRPVEAARPAVAMQEVVQRWSRTARPAPAPRDERSDSAFPRGPLSGVRILDFTAFLAGPTCSRLLADLGADVIKVESPDGDDFRISARTGFMVLNRGKRGIVLNLKFPGAREVLDRLVRESDVVVYNYRLGVEKRLGLDYETLRQFNPNIIVCRMTAFGVKGERAGRPAYDSSISALSGIYLEQAGEGNPPASFGAADISSGIAATTAILLALRAKDRTGKGQAVEATMIGAMSYVMADGFLDYAGKSPRPQVDQAQHGTGPLYRLYPTQDGWIFLAAVQDEHWHALQWVLGQPELEEERFATAHGRQQHHERLAEALGATFGSRKTAEWLALLKQARVPSADPQVETETFVMEPLLVRNETCIAIEHPYYGKLRQTGPPVCFSRTPCRIERQEPKLGEHTEEVLREVGIAPEAIRELQAQGVVLGPPAAF